MKTPTLHAPVTPTDSTTPARETQGEFRARMRATYGDCRNGTTHWRDNPAAQAEIAARKATKNEAWQAQLSVWKAARAVKKSTRDAEQAQKVAAALDAPNVVEALKILGYKLS
jgi:hypothetical protein